MLFGSSFWQVSYARRANLNRYNCTPCKVKIKCVSGNKTIHWSGVLSNAHEQVITVRDNSIRLVSIIMCLLIEIIMLLQRERPRTMNGHKSPDQFLCKWSTVNVGTDTSTKAFILTYLISVCSCLQESGLIRSQVLFFLFALQGIEYPSDSLCKQVYIG